MAEAALSAAQKDVVRRYVETWRRWRPGIRAFARLEDDMDRCLGVLADGIAVDNRPGGSVIVADDKDKDFHAAIFQRDDEAIPDMMPTSLSKPGTTSSRARAQHPAAGGGTMHRRPIGGWSMSIPPQRHCDPMDQVDADKAAKIADFLFRYMRARHRFKERLERPLPSYELAILIRLRKQEFDEIYIEPDATPPVVLDGKAHDVFDAIIKKRYRAIPFGGPGSYCRVATLCIERWSHAAKASRSPSAGQP